MTRRSPGLLPVLALLGTAGAFAAATPAPTTPAAPATPAPTRATASHGDQLDRIVAIVNDGMVLESELETQTAEIKRHLMVEKVQLPPDAVLREQVLDRLVSEEIQSQRADKAGIKVSDEQVNGALETIAKQYKVPFAQLPEKLTEQGYDYTSYRTGLRREIQRQMLQQRDVVQRITISPRELDQYLEKQKHTSSSINEYNVSHILIAVPQDATPAQLATAQKKAQDVAERAREGEAFNQLAVAYSDSATALEGGALGWRKGPELPTFLTDVIARMKPGDISELIQTSSGFHLVRLNETRVAGGPQIIQQVHLRHILLKTNEVQDDATVRQKLEAMRTRVLGGEDFAVLAKATSEDPGSAVNGGDLGWQPLQVYDETFSKIAGGLATNEISEPFRSSFGWHIVQMLGRRDFDNTDTAVREQAYNQLRGSRVDEALDTWLQQQRDEAYVEIRL
ncbi:MAG TPA: peptidylprolyl isomerase [Steroidobacteraceae bacterium]|nr:peptidylprolyl isomerase [Steroidobacteraceae bacterium]